MRPRAHATAKQNPTHASSALPAPSYQESGGTVLSTNWDEVGRGAVEMRAPEGMEVKKYEY